MFVPFFYSTTRRKEKIPSPRGSLFPFIRQSMARRFRAILLHITALSNRRDAKLANEER